MLRPLIAIITLLLAFPALSAEYHVSSTGADTADGSRARPFRTIARAATALQPGDTCILHGGTYRETIRPAASGTAEKPITFAAAPGEKVIVSGADPVTGPVTMNGRIASVAVTGPVEQVFSGDAMLPEARWPNATPEQIMDYPRATAGDGTDYETLADPNLPAGDMTGGIVLIWNGDRWWSSTRRIASYTGGKQLGFDRSFKPTKPDPYHTHDPYKPRAGNPYVIYGAKDLLDAPGEWYFDAAASRLHWIAPTGTAPAGTAAPIEVRRRRLGLDLSGLSHVRVRGIRFFGAGMAMKEANDCTVEECDFRYLEHFRELKSAATGGEVVTGSNNTFRKCSFGRTGGSGIRMRGENNRLLDSCVFDTDYTGSNDGAIQAGGSVGAVISGCTVLRTGRDGIMHGGSKGITITHNDVYNVNLLCSDSGGIYSWGPETQNGTIAYNHVHDNTGSMNVGIYLDNFCNGFKVHHNLSWNNTGAGITLNSDAENHLVANNTLINNGKNFATFAYTGRTLTQKGTRILNNVVGGRMVLTDPTQFAQGAYAPEITNNLRVAVGDGGALPPGSPAIDAGIPVPGITDGFKGKAPDIGAVEFGTEPARAGASWKPADMPAGTRTRIAWAPLPPVTEKTLPHNGLVFWLDASDPASVTAAADGAVTRWKDRSGAGHDAVPDPGAGKLVLLPNRINGKPTVAGRGGMLRIELPAKPDSPVTAFIVARAEQAGAQWQRIIVGWSGQGDDWVSPSWQLAIPNAANPTPFDARVLSVRNKEAKTLKNVTLFGTAMGPMHRFTGEMGEVLLYDRALSDGEEEAIADYLNRKWGLPKE